MLKNVVKCHIQGDLIIMSVYIVTEIIFQSEIQIELRNKLQYPALM